MPTRTELAAAMAALQHDRAAAWRFLSDFAADWRAPLAPEDGVTPEELDAAEIRLGLRLPAALRELHMLLGRRDDLCRNQDPLVPPDKLVVHEGALVYQHENQGAAWWDVLVTDLGQPDPPTVYRPDNGAGWEPWSDRLSVALADLVMAETVRYGRDRLSDAADLRDEVLAVFEPLPTLLPDGCESKWFVGDDLLLHLLGDYWMSVRARTPEALETLYENVYAEWING